MSGTTLGIGLMVLGILLYSINDAMGKWLVGAYSVGMILLVRSLGALIVLAPFAHRDGGIGALLHAPHRGLQLLRVALSTTEIGFFYWAVSYMPLADTMTYYLAGPIYVAAMSAIFLKEKIDGARWAAILVGFVGVIIVLNPSSSTLSWPALIAITGSFVYSVLMIVTRQLRGTADSTLLVFSTGAAFLAGAVLAPFQWVTPTPRDLALLLLLGVVALFASFCVNRSLKLAPASVVVPYQYTMLIWAVIFGYIFFNDTPKMSVLIGAAIIIASGLFIFFREQTRTPPGVPDELAEEVAPSNPAQP
ncbi:DMT family transporter [Kaistia dalseonensis]|uniref:DMT family transporter n=1 Tax=Kaistia dalseonensis TaxID=410840 RepID=UPI0022517A86|nr:DMT family transporter [Kaistia dalseonensis]MCX5495025.1 DMT family transporter [Kaistia dalseonensis]